MIEAAMRRNAMLLCCKLLSDCVCSTHWSNIHHTLLHALPDKSIIHFNHTVTDFQQPEGSSKVQVSARVGDNEDTKSFEGDLLVAADGSMSAVRSKFLPEDKRRYSISHHTTLQTPTHARI